MRVARNHHTAPHNRIDVLNTSRQLAGCTPLETHMSRLLAISRHAAVYSHWVVSTPCRCCIIAMAAATRCASGATCTCRQADARRKPTLPLAAPSGAPHSPPWLAMPARLSQPVELRGCVYEDKASWPGTPRREEFVDGIFDKGVSERTRNSEARSLYCTS